jgi:3-hydroxyisobutyrate dehydrogenase-like beta-hydroxyacid dehydrogenase
VTIGLIHPGEMGSAVGAALVRNGHDVVWASEERSSETAARATAAGLRDVVSLGALLAEAEIVLSIVPPHAALDVARSAAGFSGIYVDANAISPAHAQEIASLHARFVDGGIVGGPPHEHGTTRLYLSGEEAAVVALPFAGSALETCVVSDASALKACYAAWTKGTAALLLAIRDVAEANGVLDALLAEWRASLPELPATLEQAERSAAKKGWRWVGEMEEIADTFAAAGEPDGFHRAAAEVFRS